MADVIDFNQAKTDMIHERIDTVEKAIGGLTNVINTLTLMIQQSNQVAATTNNTLVQQQAQLDNLNNSIVYPVMCSITRLF